MRSWAIALAVVPYAALAAPPVAGQAPTCPDTATSPPAERAIRLVATVRARSLRLENEPDVRIRVGGCPASGATLSTDRGDLPDPLRPGVEYRDVTFRVEILGGLDVRCTPLPSPDPARMRVARDLCAAIRDDLATPPRPPGPAPAGPHGGDRP